MSKNRFAALEEEMEEEITVVKQVFQKGQTKITDTLEAIMKRLEAMETRNSLPKHIQSCVTLNEIKTQSKIYVKTLPV